MMDTCLCCNTLLRHRHIIREQLQFLRRTYVEYMQPCTGTFRQINGKRRRFIACFCTADQRMHGWRNVLAILFPELLGIALNHRIIFAVRGNDHRRIAKNVLQCQRIIHQHITGRRTHEYLHAADRVFIDTLDFLQIGIGCTHVEGKVSQRTLCSTLILLFQFFHGHSTRHRIRHLHVRCDASCYSSFGFSIDFTFMCKTGFTEMHLIVDRTGHQQ